MSETIYKIRWVIPIAMLMTGLLLFVVGVASARMVGGYAALIPSVIAVLGLLWINGAAGMLLSRNRMVIRISHGGIVIPSRRRNNRRALFTQFIPRDAISEIVLHASLKGRGIDIVRRNGDRLFVDVRHYCGINRFVEVLKQYDMPIGEGAGSTFDN